MREHARWDELTTHLMTIFLSRACHQFMKATETLNLSEGGIPNLEDLSDTLEECTSWRAFTGTRSSLA